MAMITELNCNIREAVHVKYLDGNLFSQDVYGNAIRVIVMDGDEPATLAGTVSGTAIREDGSTVALTDSRIDENVATVVLPAAAYAVPGVLAITIKISDTNTVTTLAYVVANVYRTSTDTVVDPGTIIPSITSLIEQIAEAVASIPADYSSLWAALAETFNASKSGGYAVGEYVTYDGGLYRFKNAHTGSWSSSDVDAVNLGSGIAKNASDISDLKSAFNSFACDTSYEYAQTFMSGNITVAGGVNTANKWIRTTWGSDKYQKIEAGDFFYVDPAYNGKVFIYSAPTMASAYMVARVYESGNGFMPIPDTYVGKYAAIAVQKIGYEDSDISGDVATIGNYVKYYHAQGVKQKISELYSETFDEITTSNWVRGFVVSTTGEFRNDGNHLRNSFFVSSSDGYRYAVADAGYSFYVFVWDGDTYLGSIHEDGISPTNGAKQLRRFSLVDYPNYKYIFVLRSDSDTQIPLSDANKLKFGIIDSFTDKTLSVANMPADAQAVGYALSNENVSANVEMVTKGQVYRINRIGFIPNTVYKVDNSEIVEVESNVLWTNYMKCPKYLIINFNSSTPRVYIYFFDLVDGEYVPRWDILDYTTSTNFKNVLSLNNTRNRTLSIPDGVYMRIATAVDGDVDLYGWTGEHVGGEFGGDPLGMDKDNDFVRKYFNTSGTNMVIPGEAEMWFSKNACLLDLIGIDDEGNKTVLNADNRFVMSYKLPRGYNRFFAVINLDYVTTPSATPPSRVTHIQATFSLDDYCSLLMPYDVCQIPVGRARNAINWARKINDIRWTCKKQKATINIPDSPNRGYFYKDYVYNGIPYTSQWKYIRLFGWHVSLHTYMNASNDPNSIFYDKGDRRGGSMGYGLVCSSFATLCGGWPYPQTTFGFRHDPYVSLELSNQLVPGCIMVATSHTIIPEYAGKTLTSEGITIFESTSPVTRRKSMWSTITGYSYTDPYYTVCYHKDAVTEPQGYNLTDYTIINGSARPYAGDQCVYSSDDDIAINICDEAATVLYWTECTYSNGTFTPTGTAESMAIPSGETQVNIDKTTLEDGKFYGVYTDADATMEHFEYHVVQPETWRMEDGNIIFSRNDFWYAFFKLIVCDDGDEQDTSSGCTPGRLDGDYTEFLKVTTPATDFNPVLYFKGVLGAYRTVAVYES